MEDKKRHKRLRQLLRKLNQERKIQAQKIDILCNDLIAAQREFLKNLEVIGFRANFYESIAGMTDLSNLLHAASELFKGQINELNVAFFLRKEGSFELYLSENDHPIALEKHRLENCFNNELVNDICKANKLCTLDGLLEMGLQGSPAMLNKISAATVPLGEIGRGVGFVLVYRSSENGLSDEQLGAVSAVACGLSRTIESCQVLLHTAEK